VTEIVLASLNAHGGRSADGTPFDLAAACRALAADVIALQEHWRPDRVPDPLERIAAELGAQAIQASLVAGTDLGRLRIARDRTRGCWGLAVISRLPVTGYEVVRLGAAPGDPVPRGAQLVTVELPGGKLLRVANAHLTHRFFSPVQLLRLVRGLRDSGIPTVIVGDLNMPGPVTGLAAGYRPAVSGRTFPAHRPLLQLDHVLAGPGVSWRAGEVLPPAGSDHRPVRARLSLR
jgi:endonuclease/exonuclease/phosphatase family metal-dependent hydrolase